MHKLLGITAGILFLVAFAPYILAIVRNQTKPARASWIIWACLDSITIAALYQEEAINGQLIGAVTGAWIIVILAFIYGTPGWSKLDVFCLVGAAFGIGLWWYLQSPLAGAIVSLSVVFIGAIPTFVSAWKDPSKEDKLAWFIFWLSCVFAVAAIPRWTIADAMQPLVFLLIESIMVYLLFIWPRFRYAKTATA